MNFERLSNVQRIDELNENTAVLVEQDGAIRRAMADQFGGGIVVEIKSENVHVLDTDSSLLPQLPSEWSDKKKVAFVGATKISQQTSYADVDADPIYDAIASGKPITVKLTYTIYEKMMDHDAEDESSTLMTAEPTEESSLPFDLPMEETGVSVMALSEALNDGDFYISATGVQVLPSAGLVIVLFGKQFLFPNCTKIPDVELTDDEVQQYITMFGD